MKRFVLIYLGLFIVYMIALAIYLYPFSTAVPADLAGSAVDPHSFMSERQADLSVNYSRICDWLYFISWPFQWGIYLIVLFAGLSRGFRNAAEAVSRWLPMQALIYSLLLSIMLFLFSLPLKVIRYRLSIHYGVSHQSVISWLKDHSISLGIEVITTALIVWVVIGLIRKTGRKWWLYSWLLSIPFTLFLFYIQPLVIDPLYNQFEPMQNVQLEQQILQLANQEGIHADRVYVVHKSDKTNAINAYVNGIGPSLRIVLWDTALDQLTSDQVLFVMAHEMGHYKMHHLLWNFIGEIVMSFFGLFLAHVLFNRFLFNVRDRIDSETAGLYSMFTHERTSRLGNLSYFPVLLLIFSVLTFASNPISNAVSRQAEHAADRFGIELTQNREAAVGAFQKLTKNAMNEVNPPELVKFFLYTHPTMLERIRFVDHFS